MPPRRKRPTSIVPGDGPPQAERLQKVLAAAGYGSRRACEEFITQGRVTIDGEVASELGTRVDPTTQRVCVDDETIRIERKLYLLMNKPRGVVCTNRDPAGRPRVVDLVTTSDSRLFTVGRLDESTTGLILVTNDGELANRLAHPRFQVPRTYRVQVAGHPSDEVIRQILDGIYFSDGKFHAHDVKRRKKQGDSEFLDVVMLEGKNREVRRLFAKAGHKVMSLERIAFGPLRLGTLLPAETRPLTTKELQDLRDFISGKTRKAPASRKRTGSGGAAGSRAPAAGGTVRRKKKPGRVQPTPAGESATPRRRILIDAPPGDARPASETPREHRRRDRDAATGEGMELRQSRSRVRTREQGEGTEGGGEERGQARGQSRSRTTGESRGRRDSGAARKKGTGSGRPPRKRPAATGRPPRKKGRKRS